MRRNELAFGDTYWFPKPADFAAAKLLEVMEKSVCPICALRQRSEDRFLFTLFWESINDPLVRVRLRESLGFCTYHTHQLRVTASQPWAGALGVAILYRDLVNMLVSYLRRPSRGFGRRFSSLDPLLRRIEPARPCPLCEIAERTESTHLLVLVKGMDESPWFREHYSRSYGLCVTHSQQAMHMVRTTEGWDQLRAHLAQTSSLLWNRSNPASGWKSFLCGLTWIPEAMEQANELASQCPGCVAEAATEQGLLQRVSLEHVKDSERRLCSRHRAQAGLELLRRADGDKELAQQLVQAALPCFQGAEPMAGCLFCQQMRSAALGALVSEAHDMGHCACLPHIRLVLRQAAAAQSQAWVGSLEARLQYLSQHLSDFIRKHDYRFSDEPWGAERDSWLQALTFFAGAECVKQ